MLKQKAALPGDAQGQQWNSQSKAEIEQQKMWMRHWGSYWRATTSCRAQSQLGWFYQIKGNKNPIIQKLRQEDLMAVKYILFSQHMKNSQRIRNKPTSINFLSICSLCTKRFIIFYVATIIYRQEFYEFSHHHFLPDCVDCHILQGRAGTRASPRPALRGTWNPPGRISPLQDLGQLKMP